MILHQKYTVSILEKRCLGSVYFINYTCQALRSLSSTLYEYLNFFRVYCPTADDTPFVLRMNIIFCQSTVSSPHVDTSSISTTESLSYMTWCHLVFICEYVRVRYLLHVRRMFTTSCGLLELLWVAVAIQMIWQSLHERVGVVTCILATIRVGNLDQHPHRQMKVCLSDFCWSCSATGTRHILVLLETPQDSSCMSDIWLVIGCRNLLQGYTPQFGASLVCCCVDLWLSVGDQIIPCSHRTCSNCVWT